MYAYVFVGCERCDERAQDTDSSLACLTIITIRNTLVAFFADVVAVRRRPPPDAFLRGGALFVEPQRETTLEFALAEGRAVPAGARGARWELVARGRDAPALAAPTPLTALDGGDDDDASSPLFSARATLPRPGSYAARLLFDVAVAASSGDGAAASGATVASAVVAAATELTCRYVRRSLRSLGDRDRNAFFDAVAAMAHTSRTDGAALWGPDYRSLDDLVQMHLDGAARRRTDWLHDGIGFLSQVPTRVCEIENGEGGHNSCIYIRRHGDA